MPMFDFECRLCQARFEELVFEGDENPVCPHCGSKETDRLVSMPSPLKTGAFPFKVGPVNQTFVNKVKAAERGEVPSCGGSCASCAHASAEGKA